MKRIGEYIKTIMAFLIVVLLFMSVTVMFLEMMFRHEPLLVISLVSFILYFAYLFGKKYFKDKKGDV